MIKLHNIDIHLPLRQARLKRRLISGNGTGGDIIQIGKQKYVAALQDINLNLRPGDCVGLIGENGSGKTTLLRTIAGIYEPTHGTLDVHGRVATMFSVSLSLSDRETGRQNIEVSSILHGISAQQLKDGFDGIIELCGLESFIDAPVVMYSEGMKARLGLAMVIAVNPEIMLIDEAMMVTDNHFLNKVAEKTGLFKNPNGVCIMATHAHELQAVFCNKAIWLHKGRLIKVGQFKAVYKEYLKAKSKI